MIASILSRCMSLPAVLVLAVMSLVALPASAVALALFHPGDLSVPPARALPVDLGGGGGGYGGGYGGYGGSEGGGGGSTLRRSAQGLDALLDRAARRLGLTPRQAVSVLRNADNASDQATQLIALSLQFRSQDCRGLPTEFRLDCIGTAHGLLAGALPRSGDYAQAKAALDTVSRELGRIARASRDRSKRPVALRSPSGLRGNRIGAIRQPELNRSASQVIEGERTKLLRSVPSADPRHVHYVRIAAAFRDNAVLLRS